MDGPGGQSARGVTSFAQQNNMFLVQPPNGLASPNDSAYFTGRFGLSKESSSHIPQVMSGKHSMTDGTTSNFHMDDADESSH